MKPTSVNPFSLVLASHICIYIVQKNIYSARITIYRQRTNMQVTSIVERITYRQQQLRRDCRERPGLIVGVIH